MLSVPGPDPHSADRADVAAFLMRSDDILLVTHARPDGDAIGSTAALAMALQNLGKRVAAHVKDGVPGKIAFIPGADLVHADLPEWTPKVTVYLDCGGIDRPGPDFSPVGTIANIDHHASNDRFGAHNYVDVEASSVGEMITLMMADFGLEPDRPIASALYTAMLTDTGGFRFPNTTHRVLALASNLVAAGADPAAISEEIFHSLTRGEVALRARCLSNIHFECDGRFAWSELRLADYEAAGNCDDPEGLSAELRGIVGVEVSALFHELKDGGVRASIRGKGTIDCSELSSQLGGGGHRNAAGITIKQGDYATERDRIIALFRNAMEGAEG